MIQNYHRFSDKYQHSFSARIDMFHLCFAIFCCGSLFFRLMFGEKGCRRMRTESKGNLSKTTNRYEAFFVGSTCVFCEATHTKNFFGSSCSLIQKVMFCASIFTEQTTQHQHTEANDQNLDWAALAAIDSLPCEIGWACNEILKLQKNWDKNELLCPGKWQEAILWKVNGRILGWLQTPVHCKFSL